MGFIDPVPAIIISLCFLIALLYKRVNLGITLNTSAILLALLSMSWSEIPALIFRTTTDLLTISVVLATFGIMLLSQLYRETGLINHLSEDLSRLIKNPKIVMSVLPAVLGLLPVAGGALMSAPLVDSEAEKLKLEPDRKAYVNLWFRHTVFPVYPLSQVLIVAAFLAGTTVPTIIIRQIPAVIVMVIAGYIIGFWKVQSPKNERSSIKEKTTTPDPKSLIVSSSPILAAIIVAVCLDMIGFNLARLGFDVLIAVIAGLAVLIIVSKPSTQAVVKPFKNWGIYGVTFAAYGAFLLGNTMKATGISEIFANLAAGGNVDNTILLIAIPAALGVLTASALGGVSISLPLLAGMMSISPKMASLIYMSAYLGYVTSPTHLCLTFTANYFECPLGKIYKYVIPSVAITFATVLLMYFLV